jgi:hypothetical protein
MNERAEDGREAVVDRLAEKLCRALEHADPRGEPEWADLDDEVRDIYRIAMRSVLCEHALLRTALD